MSEKLSKTLSIISTVIVVVLIVFAVIVSFLFYSSGKDKEIPSLFGYSGFSIQTDSMEKKIMTGDFILGKECDPTTLEVDDIITFYTVTADGQPFINTHRIIKKIETASGVFYETKGDNAPKDDRLVYSGDIICKYTGFRVPLLGYILTFLSTQLGFFLCIVLPVLLYTIWEIYKLIAVVMHNQKVKIITEVNENTSDAVKEAVIAEYLAKQKEEEEKRKALESENKVEENKGDTE